jgi:hypothetical protein
MLFLKEFILQRRYLFKYKNLTLQQLCGGWGGRTFIKGIFVLAIISDYQKNPIVLTQFNQCFGTNENDLMYFPFI